jgi:hypothetical protein
MTNKKQAGEFSSDENKQHDAYKGVAGQNNNAGNFANDPERAREAGRKGGKHSHSSDNYANPAERDQADLDDASEEAS